MSADLINAFITEKKNEAKKGEKSDILGQGLQSRI